MTTKLTRSEIHDFWTRQAREHKQSPSASWSDHRVIEMEILEIAKRLNDGDQVLDIGCANGYSSAQLARLRRVNLRGLDYVPEMIEQAKLRAAGQREDLLGSLEFAVGDITNLQEATDVYDKVVVIRVLINLDSWDRQLQGLHECVRVLKPGGVLVLSEATIQGWQ